MPNFIVAGGLGGPLLITEGWGAGAAVPAGQALFKFETGGLLVDIQWEGPDAYLVFQDGLNDVRQLLPFTTEQKAGIEWAIIKVQRSGSDLVITCDKILVATIPIEHKNYGGDVIIGDLRTAKVFDPRLKTGLISIEASNYYHDDVYDNAGKALLPNR